MTPEVAQAIRAEDGGTLSDAQRRLVDTYRYGGPEAARMDTQRFAGQQAQLDRQADMDIARLNADAQSGSQRQERRDTLIATRTELQAQLNETPPGNQREILNNELRRINGELATLDTGPAQLPIPTVTGEQAQQPTLPRPQPTWVAPTPDVPNQHIQSDEDFRAELNRYSHIMGDDEVAELEELAITNHNEARRRLAEIQRRAQQFPRRGGTQRELGEGFHNAMPRGRNPFAPNRRMPTLPTSPTAPDPMLAIPMY
jgi:hypothetical protein